jgi:hypothetical protein
MAAAAEAFAFQHLGMTTVGHCVLKVCWEGAWICHSLCSESTRHCSLKQQVMISFHKSIHHKMISFVCASELPGWCCDWIVCMCSAKKNIQGLLT